MRAWDAFSGLDSLVKNMMTSLHAVGELQNPAIRDRHWQQLMQATQVIYYYMGIIFTKFLGAKFCYFYPFDLPGRSVNFTKFLSVNNQVIII